MGIKGLMTAAGMNGIALVSLVLCFSLFAAILIWAITRPRREMEARARLCLDRDDMVQVSHPRVDSGFAE